MMCCSVYANRPFTECYISRAKFQISWCILIAYSWVFCSHLQILILSVCPSLSQQKLFLQITFNNSITHHNPKTYGSLRRSGFIIQMLGKKLSEFNILCTFVSMSIWEYITTPFTAMNILILLVHATAKKKIADSLFSCIIHHDVTS